jgi:molybdopterin-guanine dinucleotide biosynthesis protein A
MQTDHLIVLAVDMPFMTSRHLRLVCNLATAGCGVLPMIGQRAEPLAAIYPQGAGSNVSAALAGGDFSLQRLSRSLAEAGKLRIVPISEDEQGLYRSVNEPGDLPVETIMAKR